MPLTVYDAQGNRKAPGSSLPLPVAVEGWHTVGAAGEPALAAGTTAVGSETLQFRKYPDGSVRLRGVAANAAATLGTLLFVLPPGYRPARNYSRFIGSDSGSSWVYVYVQADGSVFRYTASVNADLSSVEFDTDTVFQAPAVTGIPLVASLAGLNPYEGMLVDFLADAVNNVVWALRYRVGVGWLVRGGSSLMTEDVASLGLTGTLSAAQIPITIPAAGVYDFAWGHRGYHTNAAGGTAQLWLYLNGVAQRAVDSFQGTAGSSITLWAGNTMRKRRLTVATAGHVADVRGIVGGGATGTSEERWLEVRPVRLT